jgi:iron complex transport system substrate-binding protein
MGISKNNKKNNESVPIMQNRIIIIILIMIVGVVGVVAYITSFSNSSSSGTINDMAGRSVDVPSDVNKTFSIAGSLTIMLYMIAPNKMIGWNSNRNSPENQYVPAQYQNLPVLGGGTNDANYESIISESPDVVFIGHGGDNTTIDGIQNKFGEIPVLDVEGDNNLTNIVPAIRFMGAVLGDENTSDQLIEFYNNVYNQVNNTVKTIPTSEKKTVYYARDDSGLSTFAPGSPQTQLIELCGGINVVQGPASSSGGAMEVSMELVLQWNPDVIITSSPNFYNTVYSNPLWQNINAVKNKQVYLVPQSPFNWFESPPGANTIMGIPWTAEVLYPDKFENMNLKNLTMEFYSKFYHYNLTDTQASGLLNSSGLKGY